MHRKLAYSSLAGLALALAVSSTALAQEQTSFDYSGFDELDVAAGVEVDFQAGPEWSVLAEFKRGGPDDIKIRQDGDRLYISRKLVSGWGGKKVDVKFTITAPELNEVEASSGSSLLAQGIAADTLSVDVSSGAAVTLYGTCNRLEIEASSGGSASAKNVTCNTVDAEASSGGSVTAYASDSAESHTSSGGSVAVYGNPPSRSANKSVSGGSTSFPNG